MYNRKCIINKYIEASDSLNRYSSNSKQQEMNRLPQSCTLIPVSAVSVEIWWGVERHLCLHSVFLQMLRVQKLLPRYMFIFVCLFMVIIEHWKPVIFQPKKNNNEHLMYSRGKSAEMSAINLGMTTAFSQWTWFQVFKLLGWKRKEGIAERLL